VEPYYKTSDKGLEKYEGVEMQIKKSYQKVNPELLYAEVRDFALKQGTSLGEAKLETYALPGNTSTFVSRGTLTFKVADKPKKGEEECLRAHIVGSAKSETKLMLDINEKLFSQEKSTALQEDLDFIFGSYEIKQD